MRLVGTGRFVGSIVLGIVCVGCASIGPQASMPTRVAHVTIEQPVAMPAPTPPAYADVRTAIGVLTSYYNAINRKEYERAYSYWLLPPDGISFNQWVGGYADTMQVMATFGTLTGQAQPDVMAVPTVLAATHTDGNTAVFHGCYFIQIAPRTGNAPATMPTWRMLRAMMVPVTAGRSTAELLGESCPH